MDMKLGKTEENLVHAEALIRRAANEKPDVIVLPETWNTGFFPLVGLREMCKGQGTLIRERIGALAAETGINIVAGSVSDLREGKIRNTAYVFDRTGQCVGEYDKTHLFSPMGENVFYSPGDHFCTFELDGIPCGIMICYDLRFPELSRKMALDGVELMFMVSQWPNTRVHHLRSLTVARAIENQLGLVCCNSCGKAENTVFGGHSAVIDPMGETLGLAGESEELLTVEYDTEKIKDIRNSIPVFRDRRPELY